MPIFELQTFVLHELNKNGLVTLMKGSSALRYTDRYKILNINYTDSSKKYIYNMSANNGLYEEESQILKLNGDVLANREDGLIFETDEAIYDKKTSIIKVDGEYLLYRGLNKVTGTALRYNNDLNQVESKNIVATYQLKEE